MEVSISINNIRSYTLITSSLVLGVKPMLQECGPYVFREQHKKVDISFDPDNGTVDFRQVN